MNNESDRNNQSSPVNTRSKSKATSLMIGFCGPGSTGKTTLAQALSKHPNLGGEVFFPSIAREVMTDFGVTEKTQEQLPSEKVLELQLSIFKRKMEQDAYGHGIYDRTPIDQLSYCIARCHNLIEDSRYESLVRQCAQSMKKYDLVFYFPIYDEIPYESDGFRVTTQAWRMLQQALMLYLLKEFGVPYKVMPMLSVKERCQVAIDQVKALHQHNINYGVV